MHGQAQSAETPRVDTKSKLLAAAARLFAQHGYVAASVRMLVAEGNVDHGSVRYHFGGKHGLFSAVLEQRFGVLCRARDVALAAVLARPEHTLEDVFDAYFAPTIAFLTDPDEGATNTMLLHRSVIEVDHYSPIVAPLHGDQFDRFLDAFQRFLPDTPRADLALRLQCVTGMVRNVFSPPRPQGSSRDPLPTGLEPHMRGLCLAVLRQAA